MFISGCSCGVVNSSCLGVRIAVILRVYHFVIFVVYPSHAPHNWEYKKELRKYNPMKKNDAFSLAV